jgi:hypothetical protein
MPLLQSTALQFEAQNTPLLSFTAFINPDDLLLLSSAHALPALPKLLCSPGAPPHLRWHPCQRQTRRTTSRTRRTSSPQASAAPQQHSSAFLPQAQAQAALPRQLRTWRLLALTLTCRCVATRLACSGRCLQSWAR